MSKPVLGYWNFRGLAQDIRCLLAYLKVDYEDKRYPPGPNCGDDYWLAEKFKLGLDFPNVPYWIEGDVKLTESRAILKYLARTKEPSLMPPTALLEAQAETLEGVALDLQQALIRNAYAEHAPSVPLEVTLNLKFEQIAKFVSSTPFALGDQVYWIDFYLYEVLKQFSKYSVTLFEDKQPLLNYIVNFEAIPELQDFFNSDRVRSDICYSRKGRIVF